jgi:hypothetical protein
MFHEFFLICRMDVNLIIWTGDLLVAAGDHEEIAPSQTPGKTVAMLFQKGRVVDRGGGRGEAVEDQGCCLAIGVGGFWNGFCCT